MSLIPELEEVRSGAEALTDEGVEGARECVVCFQGVGKVAGWVVLQPCGHLCVCKKCCAGLVECPICRQAVSGSLPVFL